MYFTVCGWATEWLTWGLRLWDLCLRCLYLMFIMSRSCYTPQVYWTHVAWHTLSYCQAAWLLSQFIPTLSLQRHKLNPRPLCGICGAQSGTRTGVKGVLHFSHFTVIQPKLRTDPLIHDHCYKQFHVVRLEVWPGYVTAVDEYEGGIQLCCDASHRVLRTQTVLELMWVVILLCSIRSCYSK